MVRESMGWRFPLRPRVTPLAARDKVEGLKASGAPRSPRSYAATRDRSRRSRSPTFEEESVIPTEAIGRGRLLGISLPRVDAEVVARLDRHRLIEGDILFARRGAQATGLSAIVDKQHEGSLCGTGTILLRIVQRERLDPRFLALALVEQRAIDWLKENAVGAVMPNLNGDVIRRLQVRVPPIAEQRAIGQILGALDDKIELNRRTNATLEAMARALFKSWFVDFDPVHAKKAGRAPEGMDAATASLFPSKLEDSELGPIPSGWRVDSVYKLAAVDYGAPYSSSRFNADKRGRPIIRIRDLRGQEPEVWTEEMHPRDVLVQPGDVLVGMDGEFRPHVWAGTQALLNQRVCRFRPSCAADATFMRFVIEEPLRFVERTEVGTTVIHLGKSDIGADLIVTRGSGEFSAI